MVNEWMNQSSQSTLRFQVLIITRVSPFCPCNMLPKTKILHKILGPLPIFQYKIQWTWWDQHEHDFVSFEAGAVESSNGSSCVRATTKRQGERVNPSSNLSKPESRAAVQRFVRSWKCDSFIHFGADSSSSSISILPMQCYCEQGQRKHKTLRNPPHIVNDTGGMILYADTILFTTTVTAVNTPSFSQNNNYWCVDSFQALGEDECHCTTICTPATGLAFARHST